MVIIKLECKGTLKFICTALNIINITLSKLLKQKGVIKCFTFGDTKIRFMAVIRVTKEFRFEMAHALYNYDGPCKNVHGHSYILYVTFIGEPLDNPDNTRNGMVMDFGDMKKIVREKVVDRFDHALMIAGFAPPESVENYRKHFGNVIVSAYQPTCENIVADIAAILNSQTPSGVSLHSIKLYETATAFAEWHASDNQ